MSSPIAPIAHAAHVVVEAPKPEAPGEGKFAHRLRELEAQTSASPVKAFVKELDAGQATLDGLVAAALSGKKLSNAELLGLQAAMYRYTIEIDLLSKVIQQAVSGLKELLKVQV